MDHEPWSAKEQATGLSLCVNNKFHEEHTRKVEVEGVLFMSSNSNFLVSVN